VLYSLKPSKRLSEIKGDISKIMSAAGNIGFLVVFLYMIYDFANGSMPGLLYALIAVILCRQLLRSYTRALAAILRLYGINNRLILNKFYIGE
jgi:vacuolar-type H+-ATPase subunit I/STV1